MGSITKPKELSGRRATAQRRILLDLIQQAGDHVDADELYRRARSQEHSISLSTVYRNLKLFKNLGLVEERHFDEDHHRYEAKPSVEHHHLICLGCGDVIEFVSPMVKQLKSRIRMENNFDIVDTEIRMRGYCSRCRNRKIV